MRGHLLLVAALAGLMIAAPAAAGPELRGIVPTTHRTVQMDTSSCSGCSGTCPLLTGSAQRTSNRKVLAQTVFGPVGPQSARPARSATAAVRPAENFRRAAETL